MLIKDYLKIRIPLRIGSKYIMCTDIIIETTPTAPTLRINTIVHIVYIRQYDVHVRHPNTRLLSYAHTYINNRQKQDTDNGPIAHPVFFLRAAIQYTHTVPIVLYLGIQLNITSV